MSTRLPPLNALKAFEATARLQSVKKAAAELNVTAAAVSHQIKALEEYLGIPLFHRRNRALVLTGPAEAGLPKMREGFGNLVEAVARMRAHRVGDVLTVSVAPSFASCWLMPRLHRFIAAHPGMDVGVSARSRPQGTSPFDAETVVAQWLADSDVAIIYGRGNFPGLHAEKLLALTITPVCAPQLCTGDRPLRRPQDLADHVLLHDDTGEFYDREAFWEVWLRAAGAEGVATAHGPHFSHAVLALEAAREGVGVVATMPVLAAADLEAGRLVAPFALRLPLASAYYLVNAEAAGERKSVRAFRDWLFAELATTPVDVE